MRSLKQNEYGFTLVEVLVGFAIIGIVATGLIGGSKYLNRFSNDVENKLSVERAALSLSRNIQNNVALYQVDYNAGVFLSMTSKAQLMKELPLAWDEKTLTDVDQCPACEGRMGFVIEPLTTYRGLYKLTIKVTHARYIETFKEYTFLVNGQ